MGVLPSILFNIFYIVVIGVASSAGTHTAVFEAPITKARFIDRYELTIGGPVSTATSGRIYVVSVVCSGVEVDVSLKVVVVDRS